MRPGYHQPESCSFPGEKEDNTLAQVVEELCAAGNGLTGSGKRRVHIQAHPSQNVVIEAVEALRSVLFPGYFGHSELNTESIRYHVGSTLDHVLRTLQEQVQRGLCFVCEEDPDRCPTCNSRALEVTRKFLARLPAVQRLLSTDVQAAYEGDPAATSPGETIFCYPGVRAITDYRLAYELHALGVPLIPRIITEHAHSITGIDIHPGASIGERVRVYQGVTLGARSFPLNEQRKPTKGIERHPIVEDEVVIYYGATILGRAGVGHRRECLADPQRAALQPHYPGTDPPGSL